MLQARAEQSEKSARSNAAPTSALLRAGSRLNAQLELPAVLETVCEEAVHANGARASAVFLYRQDVAIFVPEAAHGIPASRLQAFQPISRETFDTYARQYGFPRYMPDLLQNPDVANRDYYVEAGIQSAAVAPVRRNATLIGLLITYFDDAPPQMSQERLDLLKGFSDLAAQAISNAQLFEQSQSRLRRLEALRAIDGAIVGRHALKDALGIVVEQVREQLGLDAVSLFLHDGGSGLLRYSAGTGFKTGKISQLGFRVGDGIIGQTAQQAQLAVDLTSRRDGFSQEFIASEQFRNYLGVRLGVEGRLSGVLAIFQRSQLAPNGEWREFLEALAVQSAIAIENANLITQTRRLLRRTQTQANQIRQIVDSVPEGVVLLDDDHRVILANPLGTDYLRLLAGAGVGDSLTHLAGTPLSGLLPDVPSQNEWQEVSAEQLQRIFEVACERLHGSSPTAGWVMVISEVTEERERQKRLQMQERLATVGQLAAGIAHDFNNILGVITLYTEMLLATLHLDSTQRERLTIVNQQAQQASALIRQILDFSRQSVIERRPVELKSFVKEVVHLLERTLPENVQVELRCDEQRSYIVSADLTRLQQVLMNLAVNARDAMPFGGRLTVTMRVAKYDETETPLPDLEPGNWVVITVEDTGGGIRAEDLPRIFEPFFSTKPRGEGTGLGLAQVYGIVQQHEGHIDVSSMVGKGSTFTVYLPTPVTYVHTAEHISEEPLHRGRGETILVVEDNPIIQQALHEILLSLNYDVLLADDGEKALQLLDEHGRDVALVVSDLVMPRLGGAGLHGKIRRRHPELRMVVMTGYPLDPQSRDLLEHGDLLWLRKPFSIETIAETVYHALQADRSASNGTGS